MDTSDLANRMKEYEKRNRYFLQRRLPVLIRLDMRAGHSFTKGFKRPFDEVFMKTMQETAKYLCENVMNCKLAYVQSDEITLVLIDYEKLNTEAFFDYRVDKLCSIAASMATMEFNRIFIGHINTIMTHLHFGKQFDYDYLCQKYGFSKEDFELGSEFFNKRWTLYQKVMGTAMFDARVFNIPKEEVTNCIYWRQLDATRNSIQMVGQANFSHKELQNKSCSMIQDMLMAQKGINWNDFPTYQKRGTCVIKNEMVIEPWGSRMLCKDVPDGHWFIDKDIPIFKGEGREYIDKLVMVGE